MHAGLFVLAIFRSAFNVRPSALQTIQANAIGRRVKGRCHESFHAVGNGVHACCRSEHGRQTKGQLRVTNGGFGNDEPGVKAQLSTIVNDQDGATRHFATGATGGGHCNERGNTVCNFE